MVKAVLFDVDGVLAMPEEVFSVIYTKSHKVDSKPIEEFFNKEWPDFVLGKLDLKQHIQDNPKLWQWKGTADTLLDYWFRTEDVRNEALLDIMQHIRAKGIKCYMATEQESYRTKYMQNVMFKDKFDGIFSTCDIGIRKTDLKFYQTILDKLIIDLPNIKPNEVMFFDDSNTKVQTASAVGMDAKLYTNVSQVEYLLC